jgi:hypothetical protein
VISPEALAQRLGWENPKVHGASTLHALTTAFAPLLADLGIASCKATWISAQVRPKVTRIALHAAETGELLLLTTLPTPAALIAAGITGVGFWWKLLALAALVLLLGIALAMIFGTGPVTAAVWAAAGVLLKAAVILAILEILFVILDMLLEAYAALYPNMAAQIAALQAARRKVQAVKDKIKAKKDAGEDVTDDDLNELKNAIKDTKDAADALDEKIDADLPGATGEKKDELKEGKKATKKAHEAMKEIEKFLEGLENP